MNEIQPSNIQYLLWSDDEAYYDKTILNKDEFANLIDSIKLDHDLLAYGNVGMFDGRHNTLMNYLGETLSEQLRGKRLYSTWFIDDNNDLWCRDDTFEDGTNYYLYREFNTNDELITFPIKASLYSDLDMFDSDLVFDKTNNIGDRIINVLELNKEEELDNKVDNSRHYENAEGFNYDLIYMDKLIDEYFDGITSRYGFNLDRLAEILVKHTLSWKKWDETNYENFTASMNTIDSMKMYIGISEREIKEDLQSVSDEQLDFVIRKGKEL